MTRERLVCCACHQHVHVSASADAARPIEWRQPRVPDAQNGLRISDVRCVGADLVLQRSIALNIACGMARPLPRQRAPPSAGFQLGGRPPLRSHPGDAAQRTLERRSAAPAGRDGVRTERPCCAEHRGHERPADWRSRVTSGLPDTPMVVVRTPFSIQAFLAASGLYHSPDADRQSQRLGVRGEQEAIARARRDLRDQLELPGSEARYRVDDV